MSLENFMNFSKGLSNVGGFASSVIGGIGSAIQARKNRKLARELAQKQQDFQSAEAEKAYQRNIDMWNKQNAYNSPAAQMARLEAAGLNPNLAYGSLGSSTAGTPPAYNPVSAVQPSDAIYSNPYESISQMGTNLNANALSDAQVAQTRAQTKNVEQQTYRIALENINLLPAQIADQLNQFAYNPKMREQAYAMGTYNLKRAEKDLQYADKSLQEIDKKLEGMDYDNRVKAVEASFAELTKKDRIEAACAEFGMSIEKGKHYAEIVKNELLSGQYNVQILYSKLLEESEDNELHLANREANKFKADTIKNETKTKHNYTDPNTTVGKVTNAVRGFAGYLKWCLEGVADTVSPITGEIGKAFGGLFK